MKKVILLLSFVFLVLSGYSQRFPLTGTVVVESGGTNMLANGTFDNGDYWGEYGWLIGSGVASHTGTGYDNLQQDSASMVIDLDGGLDYTFTCDILNLSGSSINVRVQDVLGTTFTGYVVYDVGGGVLTINFTTPAGRISGFVLRTGDGLSYDIDNAELTLN